MVIAIWNLAKNQKKLNVQNMQRAMHSLKRFEGKAKRVTDLRKGILEPDDTQSMIRFLLYANEVDIEGLIA